MDELDDNEYLKNWISAEAGRRQYRRWQIDERGSVKHFGTEIPCLVHDISPGGASIEFEGSEKLAIDAMIILQLEGLEPLVAEIKNVVGGRLGIAFMHGIEGQHALAQWLTQKEKT